MLFYAPNCITAMIPGCVAHLYVLFAGKHCATLFSGSYLRWFKAAFNSSAQVCDATVDAMKNYCWAQKNYDGITNKRNRFYRIGIHSLC